MSHHDHDSENCRHHDHEHDHDLDHEEDDASEEGFSEPAAEDIFGPQVPAAPVFLQAGPVRLQFDPDWCILRRFTVGGGEALRAIYPAVRSDKWRTVPPRIEELKVETTEDSFRLTFDCTHVDAGLGIDFSWHGTITGTAEGVVSYEFDGLARAPMRTNRTGLCLLHPIVSTAGNPVIIGHGDGRVEESVFPALISPHQPFFDIVSVEHEVSPGVRARVEMEGDVFEMEDQRNWTDASFKTYGGALSTPLPLTFAASHRVKQKVIFSVAGAEAAAAIPAGEVMPVRVRVPVVGTTPLPSVGTRLAPEVGSPVEAVVDPLRLLGLGHLLIDVDLTDSHWNARLAFGCEWAAALECRMILRVVLTPNHQPALAALAAAVMVSGPDRLLAVTVVNPGEPCPGAVTLSLVATAFAKVALDVPVAAAPADNFADMNRYRPSPDFWVAPPVCPQVHSFDHESLMENIQAQSVLMQTVRSFNPHPQLVGPVALLRRRVADPRQPSLFAAAWTAGSLAAILPLGLARAVTYHEQAGPMGLVGTHCEGVMEGLAGATLTAPTDVSHSAIVAALTVFCPDGSRRVLLANLTRWSVEIILDDEDESVFEFGPYSSAWLDA